MKLEARESGGGKVETTGEGCWKLSIPAGPPKAYRLAQLDDYMPLSRSALPWRPRLKIELRARISAADLPGTWGFGLWNDPFSMSVGLGGMSRRLPALPNAAWFFFASPPNYLSLRSDLPAQGFLAATFRSPRIPSPLLGLGLPGLPLLAWRPSARLARRVVSRVIDQDGGLIDVDPTVWNHYRLDWQSEGVTFSVDNTVVFETQVSPLGPLGLVLWIDNQYGAFTPEGSVGYGTLPNPEGGWLEIEGIIITQG